MGVDLSLGALVRVRHSAQDMELARARRSVREKVTARDMVPVRLLMVALVPVLPADKVFLRATGGVLVQPNVRVVDRAKALLCVKEWFYHFDF